jgi:hypothetical protein
LSERKETANLENHREFNVKTNAVLMYWTVFYIHGISHTLHVSYICVIDNSACNLIYTKDTLRTLQSTHIKALLLFR